MRKNTWIFCIILVALFLTSCHGLKNDSSGTENSDIGTHDEENTGDDENNLDEIETYDGASWKINYKSDAFFLRSESENGAVFALLDESCVNEMDKSVYLSISYRENTSAEQSAKQGEDNFIGAVVTVEPTTINGMNAQQLNAGEEDGTVYDIYYVDAGSGCYALTLCYYEDACDTWGTEMRTMVDSFTIM